VKIGKRVWISEDVYINDAHPEQICIEDGAAISPRCSLVAHGRDFGDYCKGKHHRQCKTVIKPVIIKKNTYLGLGCTILPGVTVGEGAIVGARLLVTRDVPDWTIVTGVPATVRREVSEPGNTPEI